jgi:hypothetical protein
MSLFKKRKIMPELYKNLDGWFDYESFYDEMIDKFSKGGHFVEVGCWCGKSGTYLLEKIKETNANIIVDFVDHWLGDPDVPYQQDKVRQHTPDGMYKNFCDNVKKVDPEYAGKIHRMDSLEAVKLYEDNSLDMVFLDDSHFYEQIASEIPFWLAKVKVGGVLSGHDYVWPDVKRAVNEYLTGVQEKPTHVWYYEKV